MGHSAPARNNEVLYEIKKCGHASTKRTQRALLTRDWGREIGPITLQRSTRHHYVQHPHTMQYIVDGWRPTFNWRWHWRHALLTIVGKEEEKIED
jgi:hypothetical protein